MNGKRKRYESIQEDTQAEELAIWMDHWTILVHVLCDLVPYLQLLTSHSGYKKTPYSFPLAASWLVTRSFVRDMLYIPGDKSYINNAVCTH